MADLLSQLPDDETRHVLEVSQFDVDFLEGIFERADELRALGEPHKEAGEWGSPFKDEETLATAGLQLFFEEPSTRTLNSFAWAGNNLGMRVVVNENAGESSSLVKGETFADAAKTIGSWVGPDVVVARTKQPRSVHEMASSSRIPLINAGDGNNEHPSQAILDAYTIKQRMGRLEGLKIMAGGDLMNGRTIRSLARVMSLWPDNEFLFVSPSNLQIGDDVKQVLKARDTKFAEFDSPDGKLNDIDVAYWTRTQKERGSEGQIVLTADHVMTMPHESIVGHPLPRDKDLEEEIDGLPQAAYWDQVANGEYTRMALLEYVLRAGRFAVNTSE